MAACLSSDRRLRMLWKATSREDYFPPVLYQPYGVAHNSDGIIAVAEGFWPYSRVQLFDIETGHSVRSCEQGFLLPFGITFTTADQIAVTDHKDRTVKFLSLDLERVIGSWSPAMFRWPTGIAVDNRGYFYISDWSHGTLNIRSAEGEDIKSFTTCTMSRTSHPTSVSLDAYRRIIVSDSFEHTVNAFDESGHLLCRVGNVAGLGKLTDPRGVCLDDQDNIVVTDWGANIVRQYSPDGLWIRDLLDAKDGICNPWAVTVGGGSTRLVLTEHKLGEIPSLSAFTY